MSENVIEKAYAQAVSGLVDDILQDADLWYAYIEGLPYHLQVVYNIVILNDQVDNGGFHQYFFNAYGQFAYLAVDNLKAINAFQRSTILVNVLKEVNRDAHSLEQFRRLVFDRKLDKIVNFDDDLFEYLLGMDKEYYSCTEDLEVLMAEYLEAFEPL